MSGKRSLRRVLARQWIAFALLLAACFAAMTVLLLYMLEDRFIDQRLQDMGSRVVVMATPPALPSHVRLLDRTVASGALLEKTRGQQAGVIREFRMPDGRYMHTLAGLDREGAAYLLVYDVTDQLVVNAALARAWPWLLLMAAILAALAYAMSGRFAFRVSRQARDLVAQIAHADGPDRLRQLAEQADISEFSELARLSAQAWEVHLAALERERETLAFLAHELRTPLQSARTSLALLQDDRGNETVWLRLRRAVGRLIRSSHGVLWLASEEVSVSGQHCRVIPTLELLIQELAPLALARQQQLHCSGDPEVVWSLPAEVVETVAANLLLNAIQHGGPGKVEIEVSDRSLVVRNPLGEEDATAGFGLGLQVVQRLLKRFRWSVTRRMLPGSVVLRVEPDPAPAPVLQ